ncbi:MAG: thioesterase [Rhodocyclaceae bacterium]|nr:MAG: thioesterase [Rhodocyclaceae bacterium]TND03003.1 MAG: thioesterase [Rhodocyclaceae bacterium]
MMMETARGTVLEWQRDRMGHINVRACMEFFDAASWQFYAMLGLTASLLRSGAVNLAAVQQNISYTKELHPGDTVAVRSGVLEMRDKVLRFRHELINTETGDVCSICDFMSPCACAGDGIHSDTVVCLDPETRRSRPFPDNVAARARELLLPATP